MRGQDRPKHLERRRATPTLMILGKSARYHSLSFSHTEMAFIAARIPVLGLTPNRPERHMLKPTAGAWTRLKRCVRHIHGHGRCIHKSPIQDVVRCADIHTDGEGAKDCDGNIVSCTVTMMGTHWLRVQLATQKAPAPSSGEGEFVAQVKGASVGQGMRSMIRDLGRETSIRLFTFSAASTGIASRAGRRTHRQLDTGLLWIQHHVSRKRIHIQKVDVVREQG